MCACAPHEPTGRAIVVRTAEDRAELDLPDYLSYAAGTELEAVTSVGLTTSFPANPDWLTIAGGGGSEVAVDMTDLGCSLLMHQGTGADLGVVFTGEDATDTVATLIAYLGSAPESTLPILWRGNEDTVSVDALVFLVVNDAGERVLAVARAFGSLDSYVYAELSCNPGISTESVFAEHVAPYISVALS